MITQDKYNREVMRTGTLRKASQTMDTLKTARQTVIVATITPVKMAQHDSFSKVIQKVKVILHVQRTSIQVFVMLFFNHHSHVITSTTSHSLKVLIMQFVIIYVSLTAIDLTNIFSKTVIFFKQQSRMQNLSFLSERIHHKEITNRTIFAQY